MIVNNAFPWSIHVTEFPFENTLQFIPFCFILNWIHTLDKRLENSQRQQIWNIYPNSPLVVVTVSLFNSIIQRSVCNKHLSSEICKNTTILSYKNYRGPICWKSGTNYLGHINNTSEIHQKVLSLLHCKMLIKTVSRLFGKS